MEIKALLAVLAKNKESTAFGGAECTEERNREAVLSALTQVPDESQLWALLKHIAHPDLPLDA